MTVKDTFNSLGDGFRNAYGITDQLTFNQMTTLVNDLVPKKIIELDTAGFTYPSNINDDMVLMGSGRSTPLFSSRTDRQNRDIMNSIFMKWKATITVSYDIEWSGFKPTSDINSARDRIGYELLIKNVTKNNSDEYINCWTYLDKENGKKHRVESYTFDHITFGSVSYSNFYVQADVSNVKLTNFKIVQNPILDVTNYMNPISNSLSEYPDLFTYVSEGYYDADCIMNKIVEDNSSLYIDFIHGNVSTLSKSGIYRLHFYYRSNVIGKNFRSFWFSWDDKTSGYQDSGNLVTLDNKWQEYEQFVRYDPTSFGSTAWIIRMQKDYNSDNKFFSFIFQIRQVSLTRVADL